MRAWHRTLLVQDNEEPVNIMWKMQKKAIFNWYSNGQVDIVLIKNGLQSIFSLIESKSVLKIMEEIGNAAFRKYETCSEQILHVYLASQRSGKLGEGRNATLQPNPVKFWKFGWSDFRDFVLTIPILCPTYPFQWKILAKRHPVVLFTSYMTFVLPTHNQVSWGTWLDRGRC